MYYSVKFHIWMVGNIAFSSALSSVFVNFVDVNQYKENIYNDR
jgi:hypothetical protein